MTKQQKLVLNLMGEGEIITRDTLSKRYLEKTHSRFDFQLAFGWLLKNHYIDLPTHDVVRRRHGAEVLLIHILKTNK